MGVFKLMDRFKSSQIHALNPPPETSTTTNNHTYNKNHSEEKHKKKTFWYKPSKIKANPKVTDPLLLYGLPDFDSIEPPIEPHFKPINLVEALADVYRQLSSCSDLDKPSICLHKYSILCNLGDPELLRNCLRYARQFASDVQSKVVLSAWLKFERRVDEVEGVSAMDCHGRVLDCPIAALNPGFDLDSVHGHCHCSRKHIVLESFSLDEPSILKVKDNNNNTVLFCIENEEIMCIRSKIADLSLPLKAMLCGGFLESNRDTINFSYVGISSKGMRALEVFSRTKILNSFSSETILEMLSFANRFCCEDLKSACDAYLASFVCNIEDALILIEYGLEEAANLLVASCLQILLRELPNSLRNPKVKNIFCGSKSRERIGIIAGHASFLLYYFLSQVAMEESMVSTMTLRLLEGLGDCAIQKWQKALAFHQLGCVMLERKEYNNAQHCFEAAIEAGHVYSFVGVARTKYKQGLEFSAYTLIDSLISEYKQVGWLYQERSLYSIGGKKISDLNAATELDPTLLFPYKYRAIKMVNENQIRASLLEINKIIRFKVSTECLELRAWFYIAHKDYQNALVDVRGLLTLDPKYRMFHGRVSGNQVVALLSPRVQQWSQADCWMQLCDCWCSMDDLGSLAIIHQMLQNDPESSILRFRQSLLLLRLNNHKAALRSLRVARNYATAEHEKLVYEGWILYDTAHREEAISKADESISIKKSFEALFLKAYALADTSMDPKSSSYVIQLLQEALRCPSDGLRKGQALNNLASVYMNCGKLDPAADYYVNAIDIKHTRAHQGLACVYHLKNQNAGAYNEMTKLIEKVENNASAYEKRSEYGDREMAKNDLDKATKLDPLRTYPYKFRAAVLMDDEKESEAVEELSKGIGVKPDVQMLHLRAAFHESMGDFPSSLRDCEAGLCLDPTHKDMLDLYDRARNEHPDGSSL